MQDPECTTPPSTKEIIEYLNTEPLTVSVLCYKNIHAETTNNINISLSATIISHLPSFGDTQNNNTITIYNGEEDVRSDVNIDNVIISMDNRLSMSNYGAIANYSDTLRMANLTADSDDRYQQLYNPIPSNIYHEEYNTHEYTAYFVDPKTMYEIFRRRITCLVHDQFGNEAKQIAMAYFDNMLTVIGDNVIIKIIYIVSTAIVLGINIPQTLLSVDLTYDVKFTIDDVQSGNSILIIDTMREKYLTIVDLVKHDINKLEGCIRKSIMGFQP